MDRAKTAKLQKRSKIEPFSHFARSRESHGRREPARTAQMISAPDAFLSTPEGDAAQHRSHGVAGL
jgi:hypothetical protein